MSSGGSAPEAAGTASIVPLVPAWRVDKAFDYAVPQRLAGRIGPGALVRVPFGHRKVRGVVAAVAADNDPTGLVAIDSVVLDDPVAPEPMLELATWIARRYTVPLAAALKLLVPPRVRIAAPPPGALPAGPSPRLVTRYSGGADLVEALRRGAGGAWCVRRLPGDDHGELVAELVAGALQAARGTVLVAVPEVARGSAVLTALADHFGDVARLDSAVSDAERARAWRRLAAGHRLGAGGRAAVLAPAADLSLIVVHDEPHRSFKEQRAPRYDARRVALRRARIQGAACVMVAAAPSLEAMRLAPVSPPRSEARARRPVVEVVARPARSWLSPELQARVADALRSGSRVALLAPSRGWARAVWCAGCRRSLRCRSCESGVAVDSAPRALRCPRCKRAEPVPDACPYCGGGPLRFMGAGSERLADQVARAWPRAAVALEPGRGEAGEADVYVATWSGTGDVRRVPVGLVGVLDADALVRRPNFRAAEDAHRALVEMSEWAGPAAGGGRLVIQTEDPSHHAIQAVVRADRDYFAEREAPHRRQLGYPPFADLVTVRCSGPEASAVADAASAAAAAAGGRILGPAEVGGALEVVVKCRDAVEVGDALRGILRDTPPGTRVSVDSDPL